MNNMVTQNLPVNTTTVEAVPSTVTNIVSDTLRQARLFQLVLMLQQYQAH